MVPIVQHITGRIERLTGDDIMFGYVTREQLKKSTRDILPSFLIGDTTGKRHYVEYMIYPSKVVCAECATRAINETDSVIPMYYSHEERMCKVCQKQMNGNPVH